jgi:PAS domain S-box-containing protein
MSEMAALKVLAMRNAKPLFDEQIARFSPSIVVDVSDGVILHSTPRANELFGYINGELDGKNIKDLMPIRFRHGHDEHLKYFKGNPVARPMGHRSMTLVGLNKEGVEFPIEISLEPINLIGKELAIATILKTRN